MSNKLKSAMAQVGFGLKKHSPTIFIVSGVIGIGVSTVFTCKAAIKAKDVITEYKEDKETIDVHDSDDEAKEKELKDLTKNVVIDVTKIYAPSVVGALASIGLIVTSNHILSQRNVYLAAAYSGLSKSFKFYRKNVKDEYGKDIDKAMLHGIKKKMVKKTVVNEKTGEEEVEEEVSSVESNYIDDQGFEHSPYSKFFAEDNPNWDINPEMNYFFLKTAQNYCNDILKINKHVFLNDVYQKLGMPITKAGQSVGWVYDPTNEDIDSYIDFGMEEAILNGLDDEPVICLDFNVDGNIMNSLEWSV